MTTGLRPNERIETKILLLRGKKVMLDRYLADRHGVAIKVLKQAVHRNTERFPDGFAFVRDNQEATNKL